MIHRFNQNLTYKIAEALVASYFIANGYKVKKADKFLNYDLVCTKPPITQLIEVKLDVKAFSTQNIFWETEVEGKPGWTRITSESKPDYVYWVFPDEFKYLSFEQVKDFDYRAYPKKEVANYSSLDRNKIFMSYGHLIPIKDLPFQTIYLLNSEGYYDYRTSDRYT